tara:strand:+ start:4106 stop:5329 length:1224 start_codon:yes stop_codon:yes gene_type:complete
MTMNLGLTREELREEVGRFLGYGRDVSSFSAGQKDDVNAIIRRGLRQFYHPPPIAGKSHEWTFLRPSETMVVSADATDTTLGAKGFISSDAAGDNVKLADLSDFPAWAGTSDFIYSGSSYPVMSVSGGLNGLQQLNLVTNGLAADADAEFAVRRTYPMPENFGGIVGNMVYSSEQGKYDVEVLNETRFRDMQTTNPDRTGRPQYVMFLPKEDGTPTLGGVPALPNRWQAYFWPRPDKDYTLEFQYASVQMDGFTSGTVGYGGNVNTVLLVDANWPEWAGDAYITLDGTEYEVLARGGAASLTLTATIGGDPVTGKSYVLSPKRFPGGTQHSETILASCLAVAEEYGETPVSQYKELFAQRLAASIALDGQSVTSGNLGQNLDHSDNISNLSRRRFNDYTVTVTGQTL